MARNESKPVPHFDSLDELVKSFDSQDWGEYLEQLPAAAFEVNLKRKVHLIALDAELTGKVEEMARARHTSPETLVNAWVREKIMSQQ